MAFEKIIDNIDDYVDRGKPLGGWIFIIARNTLYDFYRLIEAKLSILLKNMKIL